MKYNNKYMSYKLLYQFQWSSSILIFIIDILFFTEFSSITTSITMGFLEEILNKLLQKGDHRLNYIRHMPYSELKVFIYMNYLAHYIHLYRPELSGFMWVPTPQSNYKYGCDALMLWNDNIITVQCKDMTAHPYLKQKLYKIYWQYALSTDVIVLTADFSYKGWSIDEMNKIIIDINKTKNTPYNKFILLDTSFIYNKMLLEELGIRYTHNLVDHWIWDFNNRDAFKVAKFYSENWDKQFSNHIVAREFTNIYSPIISDINIPITTYHNPNISIYE